MIHRIITMVLLILIFAAAMGTITHYLLEAESTELVPTEWMGYEMYKRTTR